MILRSIRTKIQEVNQKNTNPPLPPFRERGSLHKKFFHPERICTSTCTISISILFRMNPHLKKGGIQGDFVTF